MGIPAAQQYRVIPQVWGQSWGQGWGGTSLHQEESEGQVFLSLGPVPIAMALGSGRLACQCQCQWQVQAPRFPGLGGGAAQG